VIKAHGHAHPLVGSGFDIEIRTRIFPQRLNNERADLSGNGPHDVSRQTDAIVGDDNPITVLAVAQAFHRNDAMPATAEGVLEGISKEFVHDKADGEDDPAEDDGSEEYSLGATESINQVVAWQMSWDRMSLPDGEIGLGSPGLYNPASQIFSPATFGARDDREMYEDDEPSLGSIDHHIDQTVWARGDDRDLEDEHDGREPDPEEQS
jgi:hypothetical protein